MRQLFTSILAVAGVAVSAGAQAQNQTVEAYGSLPEISAPSLSPDGRWLSSQCVSNQQSALCINDLNTGDLSYVIPVPPDSAVTESYFASNDYFIVSLAFQQTLNTVNGLETITNVRAMAIQPETGESAPLMRGQRWSTNTTNVISRESESPNTVLVEMVFFERPEVRTGSRMASEAIFINELYRVNLDSGNARRVSTNEARQRILDVTGETVALVLHDPSSYEFEIRRDNARGELLYSGSHQSDVPSVMGQFDETGLLVFFQTGEHRGYSRLDLDTKEITRVSGLDLDLISGPIFDWNGYVVGFNGEKDRKFQQAFIHEGLARDVRALGSALGVPVQIEDFSEDLDLVVLSTYEMGRPDTYYLYERSAGALSLIGSTYPALAEVELPQRELFHYETADGLEIEAILTTPVGWSCDQGALPLVMLPHGGPAARDSLAFDWWAQAYAAEGYAVLQPNFRGSDGYGRAFQEAGFGEFGGLMIHDILDGARALQAAGVARTGPYCVAGGSYGGYAALMAGILAPSEVACVVAFAPVTNPATMLREERDFGSFVAYDFWEQYMGSLLWNGGASASISPVQRAEELTMPTLVLHGSEDSIVPIEQSENLNRAMGRNASQFEYVELEGETHFFDLPQSRRTMLSQSLELFEATIGQE